MIDDFMYVLENYPNVDLSNRSDREMVAYALVNIPNNNKLINNEIHNIFSAKFMFFYFFLKFIKITDML